MATERTQYSAILRVLLWEEFPLPVSIFAKLFLRFKDLNILSSSFDKVDEIDVLLKDGLAETRALLNENQTVYTTRTHRTACTKSFGNWVYSQDMTELVPVVDVIIVGPI